ncbi:MAG: hypothetical protein U0168_11655 [Nannocystaceae bacterium]
MILRLHRIAALLSTALAPLPACIFAGADDGDTDAAASSEGGSDSGGTTDANTSGSTSAADSTGGTGDTGDTGDPPSGGVRHGCPIDKPQKVYGWALDAKAVLDSDETWTPDNVYLVFGPLSVPTNLTIEAGTVVCFDYGPPGADGSGEPPPGELRMLDGGSLTANGTADAPVVFTAKSEGTEAEQLYWSGISTTGLELLSLHHLKLYNGGLSAGGKPLRVGHDNGLGPAVELDEVTIYSSQHLGIELLNDKGLAPGSHLTLYNFAEEYVAKYENEGDWADYFDHGYAVLRVNVYGASTIDESTFSVGPDAGIPPATRYVQIDHAEGAIVDRDYTLHRLQQGLTWRTLSNELLSATCTIDPGTTVAIANEGTWYIGDKGGCSGPGSLVALGTADAPIRFVNDAAWNRLDPTDPAAASPGITINSCAFADTAFDHVVFDGLGARSAATINACNPDTDGWHGELNFLYSGDGQDREGPPVTNATFTNGFGNAVRMATGAHITTDYEDPAMGNVFEGFEGDKPAICRG